MKQTLSQIFRPIALGFYALATLALTLTLVLTVSAQEIRVLPADEAVTGQVTDRLGEEWVFAACAGDVVTINMQSDEFSAYLELFPPTGRRSIAEIAATDDDATLNKVTLDESGEYTAIASGEGRSDQGAYTLMLTYGDSDDATEPEPSDGWILPDDVISSTIRTRFGEEWAFRGCEGDIIDIDMESENFDAYLELYGPMGRRPLAEDDNGGRKTDALIERFELEETGTFVIVAGGATRDDIGDYTLALAVERSEPVEPPAATSTATADTNLSGDQTINADRHTDSTSNTTSDRNSNADAGTGSLHRADKQPQPAQRPCSGLRSAHWRHSPQRRTDPAGA